LVCIQNGSISHNEDIKILDDIHLSIASQDRVAITGNNGSGKSTLIKAILNDKNIIRAGEWHTPKREHIGYLDQHYHNLSGYKTVIAAMEETVPIWTHLEVRRHLCDFLFFSNKEVQKPIDILSGGEKARLSLALISAKTPKLLILGEVTNNLDLATKQHVIEVLSDYPGALLVISHEDFFLQDIKVSEKFNLS
jgi:ATPase subunit of ABC transporter with duplicated ATPase domains